MTVKVSPYPAWKLPPGEPGPATAGSSLQIGAVQNGLPGAWRRPTLAVHEGLACDELNELVLSNRSIRLMRTFVPTFNVCVPFSQEMSSTKLCVGIVRPLLD